MTSGSHKKRSFYEANRSVPHNGLYNGISDVFSNLRYLCDNLSGYSPIFQCQCVPFTIFLDGSAPGPLKWPLARFQKSVEKAFANYRETALRKLFADLSIELAFKLLFSCYLFDISFFIESCSSLAPLS